jgi:hypothetical protein
MNPAEETSEVAVGADEATAADGGIGDEGVPRDDGAVDELRQQEGSERADD